VQLHAVDRDDQRAQLGRYVGPVRAIDRSRSGLGGRAPERGVGEMQRVCARGGIEGMRLLSHWGRSPASWAERPLARKLQSQARGCGWADRDARRPRGRLACCASQSQGSEAADSPVRWAGPAGTRPAGSKCRSPMAPRLRPPGLRNLGAQTRRLLPGTAARTGCPRTRLAVSRATRLRPRRSSARPKRLGAPCRHLQLRAVEGLDS
jgi:hypothetical protein